MPAYGPLNPKPAYLVIREETERIEQQAKARGRVVTSDRLHGDTVYIGTALPDGSKPEMHSFKLPVNARLQAMDAEERRHCVDAFAARCLLRDPIATEVVEVALNGRWLVGTTDTGQKWKKKLPRSFFANIQRPRYQPPLCAVNL